MVKNTMLQLRHELGCQMTLSHVRTFSVHWKTSASLFRLMSNSSKIKLLTPLLEAQAHMTCFLPQGERPQSIVLKSQTDNLLRA